MGKNDIERVVPDTSVIIEGLLSREIESKRITPKAVVMHEAVLAELEHLANHNKAIGFLGLDELDRIRKLAKSNGFEIVFSGRRPSMADINHAGLGEIDALIRDLAYEQDGMLFTADKVQARIAEAKGVKCTFIAVEQVARKLALESYFDGTTMSVHLRENVFAFAKKGVPGNWTFEKVSAKKLSREQLVQISQEIIEEAGVRNDGFIEIERPGSTIVQLGSFRIVIARPPLSDGWEVTAVRPIKKLNIDDYHLSEKLFARINQQAEGVLIAGAPGMGKSTFAQALAEFYANKGKVVKTVEAPRDLVLPDTITQYAISHGSSQEIHDILLLSRPDYTIFDEMRNTADFQLFADLRLAGIGLAGVVHATNPIDAIQRFVGRIELGVIPQVIDTVIFIKNGQVSKVLSLAMTVKVPSGMSEADLARPVVVVNDFETRKLEYELYSYGEETVVIPVQGGSSEAPAKRIAAQALEQEFSQYAKGARVEVISDHRAVVYVPEESIATVIGKQGKTIEAIEKKLGIGIDVKDIKEIEPQHEESGPELAFTTAITKQHVVLYIDEKYMGKPVDIFDADGYLVTVAIGKKGVIKLNKKSKVARDIQNAITMKEHVRVVLKG